MDAVHFNEFISFRIGAISRDLVRFFNNQLSDRSLTIGQALVLYHLMENNDSSIKDIAEALELDSPAASRLVDRLQRAGFVIREQSKIDRRLIDISLTPAGRAVAEDTLHISQDFDKTLRGELGSEVYRHLDEALIKIKNCCRTLDSE